MHIPHGWDRADLWCIPWTAFQNVTNFVSFNNYISLVQILMHLDTLARKGIVCILQKDQRLGFVIVITIIIIFIISLTLYKYSDSRVPFNLHFASFQHLQYVWALFPNCSFLTHQNKFKMNYELLICAVSHVCHWALCIKSFNFTAKKSGLS